MFYVSIGDQVMETTKHLLQLQNRLDLLVDEI